jgi:hypothetical protein
LNFDQTYITLFGATVFEPVTILTNTITTIFCLYSFAQLLRLRTTVSRLWAWFFLMIGVGASCGSTAHGVQYQLGDFFLRTFVFIVNALSLIAIYFCYKATSTYFASGRTSGNKYINYLVLAWIAILLIITFIWNSFLLIKIHAGIVLFYSFIVHSVTWYRKFKGSGYIAVGIFISFLSILVHSLRFSISEWFNYKDISHVIMLTSLILMYTGVRIQAASETKVDTRP